jgi:hypothetical protein
MSDMKYMFKLFGATWFFMRPHKKKDIYKELEFLLMPNVVPLELHIPTGQREY